MAGNNAPSWVEAPELWDVVSIAGKKFPCVDVPTFKHKRKKDHKSAQGTNGATVTDTGEGITEVVIPITLFTAEHWSALRSVIGLVNPKLPPPAPSTSSNTPDNFYIRTPYGAGYDTPAVTVPLVASPSGLETELTTTQVELATQKRNYVASTEAATAAQTQAAREKALAPVSVYHPALAAYGIRAIHVVEVGSPKRVKPGVYEVQVQGTKHVNDKAASTTTPKSAKPDTSITSIRLAADLAAAPSTKPSATDGKP